MPSEFSEMICGPCMMKNPFLDIYKNETTEVQVEGCPLKGKEIPEIKEEAKFWPDGWRSRLCKCVDCQTKYKDHHVEFLCDDEDMVQEYEKQGLSQPTQYEQGMQALSSMERTKQIDAIAGNILVNIVKKGIHGIYFAEYGQMKEELKTFLAKFAEEQKVVTEDDIKGFFDGLKAKRRRLNGPDLVF